MQSHVEFVKTVICSEEMAVQYLREHNLLDDPEQAVINCDKCGSVTQNKRRLIRGNGVPVMRCPRKGCQVMRSVRHGNSFFHYSDLSSIKCMRKATSVFRIHCTQFLSGSTQYFLSNTVDHIPIGRSHIGRAPFSVFNSNLFGSSFSILIYLNNLSLRLSVCSYDRPLVLTLTGFQTVTFLTSFISYILLGCLQ